MEKEQIIKALECCTSGRPCRECEYKDKSKDTFGCRKKCLIDALALIKELTEENERYKAEQHDHFEKWLKLEKATREHHSELFKEAKIAVKEDTVREFAERLKKALNDVARWSMHGDDNEYFIIGKPFIDRIADEILNKNTEDEKK